MSEFSSSMTQGSAPVAIILALALAATVGVSAQSWDVKSAAAKQAAPGRHDSGATGGGSGGGPSSAAVPTEETNGASLARVVVDWAIRGRSTDCASPSR